MGDEVIEMSDQAPDFTKNDDDYAETSFGGENPPIQEQTVNTETPGWYQPLQDRPNPEGWEYSEEAERKLFDGGAKYPMQERLQFVRNNAGQIGVDWAGDVKRLTNERTRRFLSAATIQRNMVLMLPMQ